MRDNALHDLTVITDCRWLRGYRILLSRSFFFKLYIVTDVRNKNIAN